jgi:hypothetical protein
MTDLCACGRPLHYTDPAREAYVRRLVADLGPDLRVTIGERSWLVQRHFIALHGLKAWQVPTLAFPEIDDAMND